MKITVNGQSHEVTAPDLDGVLTELGFDSPYLATALNGDFVAREARVGVAIRDGDRVEVLAPMKGG